MIIRDTFQIINPDIFAKGGDRNLGNIPEEEIKLCSKFNIRIANNIGGGKIQSSSWLIKRSLQSSAENEF